RCHSMMYVMDIQDNSERGNLFPQVASLFFLQIKKPRRYYTGEALSPKNQIKLSFLLRIGYWLLVIGYWLSVFTMTSNR
ncbi:MAG TPA: hypothetical protein PK228_12735, partial [Saprospiraceae bacterium]|nr:hypothetical protein [Saprospiraceae bacterium]